MRVRAILPVVLLLASSANAEPTRDHLKRPVDVKKTIAQAPLVTAVPRGGKAALFQFSGGALTHVSPGEQVVLRWKATRTGPSSITARRKA